jgi:glycosyltransferase involved in cell wall biosynthesis
MADPAATSVIIPMCNEAATIGAVVSELRGTAGWREIIVVDDASSDESATEAAAAGALVLRHPYNKGNGGAIKTGLRAATGEWVLILDGDGQHAPEDATRLVGHLGEYDLVVGARSPETQATSARRIGNHLLNYLASYVTRHRVPDLTSGFRAARRRYMLEFIHLLPNGFSTPTTTTLAFLHAGYNVRFEPVDARTRHGESKIKFARDGTKFFLILLKVVTVFSPLRIFVPVSALAFIVGAVYGLTNYAVRARIPNGAVILILFAIVVLLVGLVSEQVAALRFQGGSRTER